MTDEPRDDVAATLDAIQERIRKQREELNATARGGSPASSTADEAATEPTTEAPAKATTKAKAKKPAQATESAKPAQKAKPAARPKSTTKPTAAADSQTDATDTKKGQSDIWAKTVALFAAIWQWLVKFFAKIWGWLKSVGAAIALFVKTKIFRKDGDEQTDLSFFKRKSVIFGGLGAILLIVLLIVGFANFAFVTTAQGIKTTLGSSENRTVLIAKGSNASQSDLVVAVLPGTGDIDNEQLIMGTVFSLNDETYALYDGEVIWQIPLDDLRGTVLFASATQVP